MSEEDKALIEVIRISHENLVKLHEFFEENMVDSNFLTDAINRVQTNFGRYPDDLPEPEEVVSNACESLALFLGESEPEEPEETDYESGFYLKEFLFRTKESRDNFVCNFPERKRMEVSTDDIGQYKIDGGYLVVDHDKVTLHLGSKKQKEA